MINLCVCAFWTLITELDFQIWWWLYDIANCYFLLIFSSYNLRSRLKCFFFWCLRNWPLEECWHSKYFLICFQQNNVFDKSDESLRLCFLNFDHWAWFSNMMVTLWHSKLLLFINFFLIQPPKPSKMFFFLVSTKLTFGGMLALQIFSNLFSAKQRFW